MRDYQLFLFDAARPQRPAFAFPAESDYDAVRLSEQAAAGEPASLWCEMTRLLKLDGLTTDIAADQPASA